MFMRIIFYNFFILLIFISCSNENQIYKISVSSESKIYNKESTVSLDIKLNNSLIEVGDLQFFINGKKISKVTKLLKAKLGSNLIKAQFTHNNQQKNIIKNIDVYNINQPSLYSYEIIAEYPHDISLYTQGLEFKNNILYESTGLNGYSSLRKFDVYKNQLIDVKFLDDEYFGEGLTILNNKIYQLTWKNRIGFVYDLKTMNMEKSFNYGQSSEGWGLANDGNNLYKSDGTEKIWIIDPYTLKEIDNIEIVTDKKKVKNINELEIVDEKIYANTYQFNKDVVLVINKLTGSVDGIIDFGNLRNNVMQHNDLDVLNGIAFNKKRNSFFITGKRWNKIFEVKIIKN
ncbi:MAG: glutamine cyclotransferase [Flavobacteriaceae bacterium]|nr:glutamine cyclotransferase [Flavobacteriaceae bacterium]